MSRRRYDEEDDYRDGPPRKGTNPAVWIGLGVGVVFGGVVLLGCLGYFVMGRAAVAPAPGAAPATVAGPAKKLYTRDEFKRLVMGKTMEEVKAAVGPPETTQEGAVVRWYYKDQTTDPITGKTDYSAQVNFGDDGRVESVRF
jgi:hypothetical protein